MQFSFIFSGSANLTFGFFQIGFISSVFTDLGTSGKKVWVTIEQTNSKKIEAMGYISGASYGDQIKLGLLLSGKDGTQNTVWFDLSLAMKKI